jgi:hypothetical protein
LAFSPSGYGVGIHDVMMFSPVFLCSLLYPSLFICPSIKIMLGHVSLFDCRRAQEPVLMMIWAGGRFWEMFGRLRAGYEKGMTYDVWFFIFRGSIHSLFVFLSVRWDER